MSFRFSEVEEGLGFLLSYANALSDIVARNSVSAEFAEDVGVRHSWFLTTGGVGSSTVYVLTSGDGSLLGGGSDIPEASGDGTRLLASAMVAALS